MLSSRIRTAIALLAAFLACVFLLPPAAFAGLAGLVVALAAWEWAAIARFPSAARILFAAACVLVYALLAAGTGGGQPGASAITLLYALSGVFWILVVPPWLARGVRIDSRSLAVATGMLVIVPAALALTGLREYSPFLLLSLLVLVWIADTAAYFGGRRFGRHKLAPAISPGKTWEGVAAGVAAGAAYAIILAMAPPHGLPISGTTAWAAYGAIAVLLCGLSVLGDLFESAVKRHAGVKDSGSLLPGHGGVLDRIDSATSTLPVAALGLSVYSRWT